MRIYANVGALVLAGLLAPTVHAGTPAKVDDAAQYQREIIQLQTALIHTREDLMHYLTDGSASNPLSKLSSAARDALLKTLVVNSDGVISSFRISDIRSELTPTDAYRVFMLFGTPYLAGKANGQIASETDARIARSRNDRERMQPVSEGYYCNGGYCTKNTEMTCAGEYCKPPP